MTVRACPKVANSRENRRLACLETGFRCQINAHTGGTPMLPEKEPGKKQLDDMLRLQHVSAMKTAAVHSRIQPEIKEQAESILHRLGLSPTEAIRIFYTQITLRKGLPFEVAIPNATTRKALKDSEQGINLTSFDSVEKLFESWDK